MKDDMMNLEDSKDLKTDQPSEALPLSDVDEAEIEETSYCFNQR